jgi:hypothetical protein
MANKKKTKKGNRVYLCVVVKSTPNRYLQREGERDREREREREGEENPPMKSALPDTK